MKQVQVKLYEFSGLNKEVQEKIISRFQDDNNFAYLSSFLYGELYQELKSHDIKYDEKTLRIYFSFPNCQGDGVMFEAKDLEYKGEYYITVKHYGLYYHENSKMIEVSRIDGKDLGSKEEARIEREFNAEYISICKELERSGYNFIDGENDPAMIQEEIEANEYMFYADGSRYNSI